MVGGKVGKWTVHLVRSNGRMTGHRASFTAPALSISQALILHRSRLDQYKFRNKPDIETLRRTMNR